MRVFIGGIMQGSRSGNGIEDQEYRAHIAAALRERWSGIEVIDPFELHPNSVGYGDDAARETLFAMVGLASEADVVIVYLPSASMGTALEMYGAHQHHVPVLAISPMSENWVVRAIARRVFPDLRAFYEYVKTADSLV